MPGAIIDGESTRFAADREDRRPSYGIAIRKEGLALFEGGGYWAP